MADLNRILPTNLNCLQSWTEKSLVCGVYGRKLQRSEKTAAIEIVNAVQAVFA